MFLVASERVRMYSEQGLDLRGFRGRIDAMRGTYAGQSRISGAQAKLYSEVLCNDQIVWCSLAAPESIPLSVLVYLHIIDIDRRDIAAVLDGFIWEHIIGNERCVPPEEHEQMRMSCCFCNGDNHAQLRGLENAYIAENLPDDPWSSLLASDLDCRMPQVLVAWPFKHSRIVSVDQIVPDRDGIEAGNCVHVQDLRVSSDC